MKAHTPGPWAISELQPSYVVGPQPDFNVVAAVAEFDKYGRVDLAFKNGAANARLIAAAPDLLTALKRLMEYSSVRNAVDTEHQEMADAAIAKAEGMR
jgi:hypothetical protein